MILKVAKSYILTISFFGTILLSVLSINSFSGQATSAQNIDSGTTTFSNKSSGFEFQIPKNWKQISASELTPFRLPNSPEPAVVFNTTSGSILMITSGQLDTKHANLTEFARNNFYSDHTSSVLARVSHAPMKIGQTQSWLTGWRNTTGTSFPISVFQIVTIINGTGYMFTYLNKPGNLEGEQEFPTIARMLQSIKFSTIPPNLKTQMQRLEQVGEENQSYRYITKWGSHGSGDEQFIYPLGIAVDDSTGEVYVVDAKNSHVQRFDKNGQFILKWGSTGLADGQFIQPSDVVTDSFGNVYVTEMAKPYRIQKFDKNGNFILKWTVNGTGGSYIARDIENNIYVSERISGTVRKFTDNGSFIMNIGTRCMSSIVEPGHRVVCNNPLDGEFLNPTGIAIDHEGNLVVADTGNSRIQKFDNSGRFLMKWEPDNEGMGGVAVDSLSNIYVDALSYVQKFTGDGQLISEIGTYGFRSGQLNNASDISLDQAENFYLSDSFNSRIQKFAPVQVSSTVQSTEDKTTAHVPLSIIKNLTNSPPIANAGGNQMVNGGSLALLNGSASTDTDGDKLTYFWEEVSGPIVKLINPDTAFPTFSSPLNGNDNSSIVFRLTVYDGKAYSKPDLVSVSVLANASQPNKMITGSQISQNQIYNTSILDKTYTNPKFGVTIDYPSDWSVSSIKEGFQIDKIKNSVYVDFHELGAAPSNLSKYVKEDLKERGKTREDFNLIQLSQTTFPKDTEAYNATYTFSRTIADNKQNLKVFRVWTTSYDKIFTIAYASEPDIFDIYRPTGEKIIQSLKFNTNQAITKKIISGFSTYENQAHNVKIQYPDDWKKVDTTLPNSIARFIAPNTGGLTKPTGVLVSIFQRPTDSSLNEFIDFFHNSRYSEQSEFTVVNSSDMTLGGLKAKEIILYEQRENVVDPASDLKVMRVYAFDNNTHTGYTIRYYSEPGLFNKYLPTVEKMIESFEIGSIPTLINDVS